MCISHNIIIQHPNKTVDQYTLPNTEISTKQGRSQDLAGGGGQEIFFQILNSHVLRSHALCYGGGSGHAPPPRKFFKMVQFGAS